MTTLRTRVRSRTRLSVLCWTAPLVLLILVCVLGCAHYLSGVDRQFWQSVRPVSEDVSRLLHNAHYLKQTGRNDLAVKELEEAYQREPSNLKVVNLLAQSYEELGNFKRAQQLYQEVLVQHSSNPALNNNLCYSYYLAGRWEQAEACFRQALERDPQNAAARNNLGLLLCRLDRVEEAQRLWTEAEGEVAARHKLTQVLTALGQKVPPASAPLPRAAAGLARPPAPAPPAHPAPQAATAARPGSPTGPPLLAPAPAPTRGVQPTQAEPGQPWPMMKAQEKAPKSCNPAVLKPQARPAPKMRGAKAAQVAPAKPTRPRPLTVAELVGTGIELRNGNGIRFMARRTRLLLSLEGFTVTRIGNYIDFGADKTVIYFRPEAARVAQALNAKFFKVSRLEESAQLPEDVAVKIILGHDLVDLPELSQRLALRPEPAAPSVSPESGPASALSPQELRGPIELRNGNGVRHFARRTRTLLTRQGFRVARIGNHRDFGAETTVIYYRSRAARMAQALNAEFFKTSRMEANARLQRGVQVKVILGRDLLRHQELLTSLAH
jgi:Tfp pilus assembly protein PilF